MGRLFPNRWPVKWRIAATSALLTFLILLGFAFVVGRLAVNKLEANFREEAQSTANDLANQPRDHVLRVHGERTTTARGFSVEEFVMPRELP